MRILEEVNQEVPRELRQMADRFTRMKDRPAAEGGDSGGFRGGCGGGNYFREIKHFCIRGEINHFWMRGQINEGRN